MGDLAGEIPAVGFRITTSAWASVADPGEFIVPQLFQGLRQPEMRPAEAPLGIAVPALRVQRPSRYPGVVQPYQRVEGLGASSPVDQEDRRFRATAPRARPCPRSISRSRPRSPQDSPGASRASQTASRPRWSASQSEIVPSAIRFGRRGDDHLWASRRSSGNARQGRQHRLEPRPRRWKAPSGRAAVVAPQVQVRQRWCQ